MHQQVTANPTKPDTETVAPGHIMAFTYYGRVTKVANDGTLIHLDSLDYGFPFTAQGKELIDEADSADTYAAQELTSQTDVIKQLVESGRKPFTACFVKDNGEERVLRGRLIGVDQYRGRSQVEDLDQPADKRFRLVDHRTLKYVIVDGTKYVAKT